VLIGGAGSLYGAIVGGLVYELMVNLLATNIPRWEMFSASCCWCWFSGSGAALPAVVADRPKMARSREVRAKKI
jgi:ABC-type branched-subunit amino acid transport system permease subunit